VVGAQERHPCNQQRDARHDRQKHADHPERDQGQACYCSNGLPHDVCPGLFALPLLFGQPPLPTLDFHAGNVFFFSLAGLQTYLTSLYARQVIPHGDKKDLLR
jgi:hypothetical protein